MPITISRRAGALAVATVALGLVAVPAGLSQGNANTVELNGGPDGVPGGGGETRLALNGGTAATLARNGIRVAPIGRADATGSRVDFPITGGQIVPNTGVGVYLHDGSGLRLSSGGTRVNLTSFNVNTRTGRLTALVGGRRITIANLLTGKAKVIRRGPGRIGTWVVRVQVNLSAGAATALNQAFDTRLFKAGLNLGRADVRSEPLEVILNGGSTRVTTSATANGALQGLGVGLSTVPPAAADTQGRLNFPIDGRKIDLAETSGIVAHEGGIALAAGSTTVRLTNFDILLGADVFPEVALTSLVNGANRTSIFLLDTSKTKVGVSAGQLVLTDVGLDLTGGAASALNAAFGVSTFSAGIDFGTARVQARVR